MNQYELMRGEGGGVTQRLAGADPEILKGGCTKFSGPELPYSGFDPFFESPVVASL